MGVVWEVLGILFCKEKKLIETVDKGYVICFKRLISIFFFAFFIFF